MPSAPKPLQLRVLEGTDRQGRQGGKIDFSTVPDAPKEAPTPPHTLSKEGRRHWDKLCRDLEAMDMLTSADANSMAAYCEAAEVLGRSSRKLHREPLVVTGDRGGKIINPAIAIQREASRILLRYAQEFGLTPAARTRVEVQKRARENDTPVPVENPFDQQQATG